MDMDIHTHRDSYVEMGGIALFDSEQTMLSRIFRVCITFSMFIWRNPVSICERHLKKIKFSILNKMQIIVKYLAVWIFNRQLCDKQFEFK